MKKSEQTSLMYITRTLQLCLFTSACVLVPAATLLASEGHGPPAFEHTFKYWSHFIAFVLLFYILLRKPFAEFWLSRSAQIEDLATEGEKKLAEADIRLTRAKRKLDSLQKEVSALKERATTETEHEYNAILSEATARADMILAQADSTMKSEKLQQELELQNEFANQVITLARKKLTASLTSDEDQALRESVLKGLQNLQ